MSNRADADIFAKTLLSDADMQRIVSCAAPIPLGKLRGYLYCREAVVISSIRSATAAAAAARITQLETENATHLARIAELESQLAAETERLEFMFSAATYVLSGDAKLASIDFPSPRAAIDAGIKVAKGGARCC